MGHSASIAKKYSPQYSSNHGENDRDDCDSLATVSSYRPTSPLAHLDAQQFNFEGTPTPRGHRPRRTSRNGLQSNGTVPNGSLSYRRNPTVSSSTLGTQPMRSMRDVNHFLVKNPELLSRKHTKSLSRKNDFDDIEAAHKQIKTKQNLYLGFFDPPTIYGKGVDPEKQLKINQRVYLQLIHPTYNQQYFKPYRPLVPRDMIVVRKEDYTRKPPLERTRPPMKGMEVIRASPSSMMIPYRQSPSSQHFPPEALSSRKLQHREVHSNRHILPSSTPVQKSPARKSNDYVDVPDLKMKQQSSRGLSKLSPDLMEVERRFDTQTNSLARSATLLPKDEDIVFDYSVEELGLKKKSKAPQQAHLLKDTKGDVEPLYFRKSLAYNPKYPSRGNVLSDPL